MKYLLEAKQLSKSYENHTALDGLNLTISAGEIFCLLGQNGAGKTTTINLLLGYIEATSGAALINGITVNHGNISPDIAYIPEVVQLYGYLSGIENLDFFSKLAGYQYTKNELEQFLMTCGLQPEAHDKRLSGYSKGMRQKVGIAITLAKNAKVILMDEPTSGLDPKATAEFTTVCKDLAASGKAIFMATHDLFNAVNVGTRIGIMKEGRMLHELNTNEISANELQALYMETI